VLAIENNPPSAGLNGEPYAVRNEEPGPPRVALALQAIDRAARNARTVRALEKAIAREEREQDEKMALFDDLERYYLDELACLADEIGAHGAQIARYTEQIHLLKGEGWAHG